MKEKLKELEKYISFYSPGGGLHFYIDLKEGKMNCLDLFFKCKKEGVLITPGVIFYKDPEEGLNHFRLGFSQTKEKDIEKGIDIIKNILENN
ncbi:transcriptional regulatory protein [Clostridium tetanomorphum]|nr:transcriptional regulatory protein [Clostridium tetanomorphum]